MITLEEIYTQYKHMVFNLALQYVQNIEDAEEIVQDVFLQVHSNLPTFREEATLSTWIYRISINQSLNFIRARNRQKRFAMLSSLFHSITGALQVSPPHFNHPGIILEQKEEMKQLFNHINTLPNQQKTVLILLKIENMSQKEVAEILELSEKAVESLMQRAKKNLSKKINASKENEK